MVEVSPKHVVHRYVSEILNGGSVGSLDALIADEALRQRATALRAAFPDLLVAPLRVVAEGSLVALHATGRATHRGIFQGCPPTGREWSATHTAIYRIDNGRIAEAWGTWDLLSIWNSLGE